MTDSIDTSEREACEPRMLRLPVREMAAEPAPPPVAAGYEVHPVGTVERLRRLERVNARYEWLRERLLGADLAWGDPVTCVWVFKADALISADLDASIDAALTSATKETT